jgi:hypothetical protein
MAWIKVISLLIIIGIVGSVVADEWPGHNRILKWIKKPKKAFYYGSDS